MRVIIRAVVPHKRARPALRYRATSRAAYPYLFLTPALSACGGENCSIAPICIFLLSHVLLSPYRLHGHTWGCIVPVDPPCKCWSTTGSR